MQPTVTTPLPVGPEAGYQRPAMMSALALAEHLVAAQVPVPTSITISAPCRAGDSALVKLMAHHDLSMLHAWQRAFGGEITHSLYGDNKVFSYLHGRIAEASFEMWTLRDITSEQQVMERQMLARWVDEHGVPDDWADDTRTAYLDVLLRYRLAVAA